MFAKLLNGMNNLIAFRNNPMRVFNMETTAGEADIIGEKKVKDVGQIAQVVNSILKKIVGPVLAAIGIASVIYAIYLGIMFAKAESAEKRKDIQGRLIGAIIGAVIVIVAMTLCFSLNWAHIYYEFSGTNHKFEDGKDQDVLCDWCYGEQDDPLHNITATGD